MIRTIRCSVIFVGLVFCILFKGVCSCEEPLMQAFRDSKTGQIVISERIQKTGNIQKVLIYNYKTIQPAKDFLDSVNSVSRKYARARSNYIHPLYGPDGEVLTVDWSKDHPHHRGIYWAWPEVDWQGRRGDLHALQHVFARPTGEVKLQGGPEFARVEAENRWLWENKTPIVHETVIIKAHRSRSYGRYIDLTFCFESISDDVSLARRGTDKYGGLNIRLSPVDGLKLIHHTDPFDSKVRMAWSDSIGIRQGGVKPVGFAVFEKITNPDYPGDWIEYPELPWFQPTFPAGGTRCVLKRKEKLVLRYRMWIRRCSGSNAVDYAKHWTAFNSTVKEKK